MSDCGGKNVGLWKELGVTCSRTRVDYFIKHPVIDQNIYVFADTPHLLKLLRNWFLDGGFVLEDGTLIKKFKVLQLFKETKTEISPTFKLSELHFECKGNERMNVSLATQLLSHTTATCLKRYFRGDEQAESIANFIELVNQWFDVMNSYTPSGPYYKRGCGLQIEYQSEVLRSITTKWEQFPHEIINK